MSYSPDHSESEYLIDFLNKIPLNETESYKEIKKLNLNKLETTILKLNNYKKCKGELMQQNQNLLEKIQGLSEALDEQEKKCEEYREKVSNYHENIEIIERKQQINKILNTEQSISDYIRDNIEEIRKVYPSSYFCRCNGDYEKIKVRYQDLAHKYQILQEHCDGLEANNQNLSKSVSSLIDENQRLQIQLIGKPAEQKRKMKVSISHNNCSKETIERYSFFKREKRTASLRKKKKNEPNSSNTNESEKNISIFQEIENTQSFGTFDFKEDSHSLLSDMENSTISKQETKDLINNQGFCEEFLNQKNEMLEKFNNLEVESPTYPIRTSKAIVCFPKPNTLKIHSTQEKELEFPRIQDHHIEDKINYFDIAIFLVLAPTNLWFKFMKKISNVILRK